MAEPAWFEVHAVVRALEGGDLLELACFIVTPLDDDGRRWDGTAPAQGLDLFDALRRGVHLVDP